MDKPKISQFFENHMKPDTRTDTEIRYAMAALLIACAKADDEEDPDEENVIVDILQAKFAMEEKVLTELIELTDIDTGPSKDKGLQTFTDLVNSHYTDEHKIELIRGLWQVAFADGRVDRYEEVFINRVASMINISPSDVQKAKTSAG